MHCCTLLGSDEQDALRLEVNKQVHALLASLVPPRELVLPFASCSVCTAHSPKFTLPYANAFAFWRCAQLIIMHGWWSPKGHGPATITHVMCSPQGRTCEVCCVSFYGGFERHSLNMLVVTNVSLSLLDPSSRGNPVATHLA